MTGGGGYYILNQHVRDLKQEPFIYRLQDHFIPHISIFLDQFFYVSTSIELPRFFDFPDRLHGDDLLQCKS